MLILLYSKSNDEYNVIMLRVTLAVHLGDYYYFNANMNGRQSGYRLASKRDLLTMVIQDGKADSPQ